MPNMISLRKLRLASTSGHVVHFDANTPTNVPQEAVREAMALGCVPVNAEEAPEFADASRAKIEFGGELRESLLFLVISRMIEENDVKQFDSGGRPKASALSKTLGFDVSAKEAREAHKTALTIMAQDGTPDLHPDAEVALEVIDAGSKSELLELAGTLDVPKKETDGLTARKLRSLLVSKLAGAARG